MQSTGYICNKTSHPLIELGTFSTHIMLGINITIIQNYIISMQNGISFFQKIILIKFFQVVYISIPDNDHIQSEIFCNLP